MYNNNNIENDTIVIKKGSCDYHVKRNTDVILYYITPTRERKLMGSINTTFESIFGYKAADHKAVNPMKRQFNNNNNYQSTRKPFIVNRRPTTPNNNNDRRFNNNNYNNNQRFRKPNIKNTKPIRKQKVLYKTNFHKGTIYYPDSIEGFLAINNKLNPEAVSKDVKIIATFANIIDYSEIKDYKFFSIKHRSNFGHIKVLENEKLVSYENPFAKVNIQYTIEQLSRFVDIIFVPANDTYLDELLKTGREVTIVYPSREMKDEYLLYIKSFMGNASIYHTFNKYFDIFIDRIEELKRAKYSNTIFVELMRLSELKSIVVNPNVGSAITFDIAAKK